MDLPCDRFAIRTELRFCRAIRGLCGRRYLCRIAEDGIRAWTHRLVELDSGLSYCGIYLIHPISLYEREDLRKPGHARLHRGSDLLKEGDDLRHKILEGRVFASFPFIPAQQFRQIRRP